MFSFHFFNRTTLLLTTLQPPAARARPLYSVLWPASGSVAVHAHALQCSVAPPTPPGCALSLSQVMFYQTLGTSDAIASWPFYVPRAVVAEAGFARTLIAMEDIRLLGAVRQYTPFDVGSPLQHVPLADAIVVARALGGLQARFWGKTFAPPGLAGIVAAGDRLSRTLFSIALPAALKAGRISGELARLCVAAGARGGTLGVSRLVHAAWNGPPTFVHGDMNPGNVYMLPNGIPGLLDFQTWAVRSGSPISLARPQVKGFKFCCGMSESFAT
jgi:hypothetical protein